ncbi:MAG: hypothetical protein B7X08_06800, partial [Acidocella sp. 20-63-7]
TIASPDDRLAVEAVEKLIAAPIPRIEIPGLDLVDWAEGDARRDRGGRVRGGRSRTGAKAPAKAAAKPRGEEEQPREREPSREQARETSREQPRERERTPRPPRAEPRREEIVPRREPRTYYASDNGPNVRGFGNDIPAFMLIRRRGPQSAILDDHGLEEDVAVIEAPGDEEAAA